MEIETLLHKEIAANLKLMENMSRDSDEYKQVAKNTNDLMDRAINLEKIHAEAEEKEKNRELDRELKLQQFNEERKGRIWRDGIAIAGIVLPTWLAVWGTKKSFEFEKEGTITTIMGRGFLNKLLPKK